MASSTANLAKGTLLQLSISSSLTTLFEVKDIDGPGYTRAVVDSTHQESTLGKESVPGLLEPGEVTFDVNWHQDNATHQALVQDLNVSEEIQDWRIIWPLDRTSSPATQNQDFKGYVTSFDPSSPVEGIFSASLTIQLSEMPTYAT